MQEMGLDVEVPKGEGGSRDMVKNSVKSVIFDTDYLNLLKAKITSLESGDATRTEIKALIVDHGTKSVEQISIIIDLYIKNIVKSYFRKKKKDEKTIIEYKKLLVEIAPRINRVFNNLNTKG